MGLVFAMASVGLPGLGNFVAEFLILLGAFQAHTVMAVVASLGLLASLIYTLRMIQRIFFGKQTNNKPLTDLNIREKFMFGSLLIVIVWLGIYPRSFLNVSGPAVHKILQQQKEKPKPLAYRSKTLFFDFDEMIEVK
jgi:NADH-quinone oxidoreductase subunit M